MAACGPPTGTWSVTTFTTETFIVHICESTMAGGPIYYRGRNPKTGDHIDLPAQLGDVGYSADNGVYQYYVSADVLSVYKGDQQILEEPVLTVS